MNNDLGIDIHEGVSQNERLLAALVPCYVKIDEREISDFLFFTSALSEQLNYFNHKNHPDGSWDIFFKSDAHVLAVLISRLDVSKHLSIYNQHLLRITSSETDIEAVEHLKILFEFILNSATFLDAFKHQFQRATNYNEIREIHELVNQIDDTVAVLKAYNLQAYKLAGDKVKISFDSAIHTENSGKSAVKEIFNDGVDMKKKIVSALPYFTDLYKELREKYSHLSTTAEYYLKVNNLLKKQYAPHLGLFIAFLGIYKNLKNKINDLPKRHLDFYFKDELGILNKPAEPDRVHLLFEKDEGPGNVLIKTSDILQTSNSNDTVITYKLLVNLLVTKARIAELKTVFVSNYLLLSSNNFNHFPISERQVYSGTYPVFNPVDYLKNPSGTESWPIQGKDQHDLSGSQRSMDDTDIGIIIGSPLFYQTEGERSFRLTIHFDKNSTTDFKTYVESYAQVTNKKESIVFHELLSPAFVIQYTSDQGWAEAGNYTIRFIEENTGALEIIFSLSSSSSLVHAYNSSIHGENYESEFPLIRLVLNNYSSHHPYSFFWNTIINRVSISVKVKNNQALKLQNNIGTLSASNPFQPFGPQPSVGSFLNIKNTNIFNRYTKDFCLRIEWLDLPKNKEGFDSYYQAYNSDITNKSFKVGISSLLHGRFKPEPANQQLFSLFETTSDHYLKDHTVIQDVDFKKIEFLNSPQLIKEEDTTEVNFKDGTVKLELLTPPDTFGYRLFPQIFPEVVMNNAKIFTVKRPLPNPPYIPSIKFISVDYSLAHTEPLKDDKEITATNELILIHKYPFGHERIYPKNNRKTYFLMPQFHNKSNLYIGINGLQPNQELSLLFQLEEKNFHHTVHEPELIKWSCLIENSWVSFSEKNVLYDTTNNFINSGIVKLRIPQEVYKNNSILNPELFWLNASGKGVTDIGSRVIAIHTNAVTAERFLETPTQDISDFNLPANTIKNFSKNIKGIQNSWQLFPSFGGRPSESTEQYYVRVSERLRHKQRPVQLIDIIQVILEKFPEILIVKCFNNSEKEHLVLPGVNLQVILIPKEKEDGHFISEEPKVSLATLYKVKKFLMKILSPFLTIEVGNPVYEKVKVACKVIFTETEISDNGFYLRKLNEDINSYISPWLYGQEADIKIGSKIYKSDILNFIKTRPYVSYTTGFSVIHFYKIKDIATASFDANILDTAFDTPDYISCSSQEAVLIPSANHLITVLNKSNFEEPSRTGINGFSIGEELLITNKYETTDIPDEPKPVETETEELFSLIITHHMNNTNG